MTDPSEIPRNEAGEITIPDELKVPLPIPVAVDRGRWKFPAAVAVLCLVLLAGFGMFVTDRRASRAEDRLARAEEAAAAALQVAEETRTILSGAVNDPAAQARAAASDRAIADIAEARLVVVELFRRLFGVDPPPRPAPPAEGQGP